MTCAACMGDGWLNAGDDENESRCSCNPAQEIDDYLERASRERFGAGVCVSKRCIEPCGMDGGCSR